MERLTTVMSIVLVFLLAACGGDDSAAPTISPTEAATSTPSNATTSPTATSPSVPPSATRTPQSRLPGDISEAIDEVKASDSARLGSLLTSTQGPCVVNPPPGILYPPACPAGASAGTSVPALVFGGCPDEFTYIDPSLTFRVTGFDGSMFGNHLIGVVDLREQPLQYAACSASRKWAGWGSTTRGS